MFSLLKDAAPPDAPMLSLPLPTHKADVVAAEQLVAAGMPAVEPMLGPLLEWFQDYNWPVAQVLALLFEGMGSEVVPHLQRVLGSDDEVWKYWLVTVILPRLAPAARQALRPELERIARRPTDGERREEVWLEVQSYLEAEHMPRPSPAGGLPG
jgi:hypothetical protein